MPIPKLVGIVGNNAPFSYNRILLQYMSRHFHKQATLEVSEIDDIPLFNERDMKQIPVAVKSLRSCLRSLLTSKQDPYKGHSNHDFTGI